MKLGKPEVKPALMQAIHSITTAHASSFAMRDEVKTATFAILGIDPDSLGVVTKGAKAGTKIADKLLSASFSELKKEGLTDSPLRNRYALTDAGLGWCAGQNFATNIATVQAPLTASAPEAPVEAEKAPVEAPVVNLEFDGSGTFSPVAAPAKPAPIKVKPAPVVVSRTEQNFDSYIKGLMAQSSPCYGVSPSSRAKTCKSCPLLASCQRERNTRLIELAASLESQAARLEVVDLAAPEPEVETAPELPEGAIELKIDVDGMPCEYCSKEIPVGEKAVILKGKGMFHHHCVAPAIAKAS